MKRMFSEVEMCRDVAIPAKQLKKGHSPRHQQILTRLLQDLLHEKACREHGFYLAITALKSIGNINSTTDDDNPQADDVLTFPVSFTCRTFLPARGNIMVGTVMKVLFNGLNGGAAPAVLISSGPLRYAYLSYLKMPDYHFVPPNSEEEEEPCFQKDDLTKIAVGVVVRFVVLGRRFKVSPEKRRTDVYVLASVEGDDTLGPVSLTGCDRPYM
ncbi:hypothetical protein Bca4012_044662 [Brassica carinata]|uniref:DNA-directed RNA polymerase subunit n=3 Tax=Brassica TaxID=3705 RepID=A0A8X7UE60_BRACI|nr:hypothetical protein Bca52824_057849 [Brassica carinata]VDD31977.1 unnamed protein product [Brassica oleracea]